MIIGYLTTGEIRVYEDIDSVISEWGQYLIDLVSEEIILYDNDGAWLKPIEKYAQRTWYRWYKKLESVEFKRVEIVDSTQDSLSFLLKYEATTLTKNKYVESLDELRKLYPHNE